MTDKKDPGKFTIRFNICDPQHKAVIDLLNRQGRSKAQFLVSAVLHYINCKETPEVSVPVPNQAALEELILAILTKNQSYLKKQPEPKPSTAQQDAAISAASEPMPPADGAELEQWFGGQDGGSDPELSENVRAGLKAKDRSRHAQTGKPLYKTPYRQVRCGSLRTLLVSINTS